LLAQKRLLSPFLVFQVCSRCLIYKVHTAHRGRSFIVPHSVSLVKNFFLVFHRFFASFASFRSLLCGVPLRSGTFISYHKSRLLSSVFSRTFDLFLSDLREKLFIRRFSRLMSEANLTIIAWPPLHVKHLFSLSSKCLTDAGKGADTRTFVRQMGNCAQPQVTL